MACENYAYRNSQGTVLDTRLYDKILGVNDLIKRQVYWVWIHKKFIPKKILEINNQQPILYDYTDSISSIS